VTLGSVLLAIYLGGVAIGLAVMRDRWPERLVTAAAWPLGVLALAVVVVIQFAAALYLWPVPILVTLALLSAIWIAF
jgi:hypothetical protein